MPRRTAPRQPTDVASSDHASLGLGDLGFQPLFDGRILLGRCDAGFDALITKGDSLGRGFIPARDQGPGHFALSAAPQPGNEVRGG